MCSEEVIILGEIGSFSEAFAIFKETGCAKNALAARTIAIENQTLSVTEASNIECSKVGTWRKARTKPEARLAEASSSHAPWSLPYAPYSRIHQMVQSPIWNAPTPSPRATVNSIISDNSRWPLLKPQVASPPAEARQLILNPQSHLTTQASDQANPAASHASYKEPAVTTGIAGQVATSIRMEPPQQDLDYLSTAPVSGSSVFNGSHSSLPSAIVPSAVAFVTAQGDIPSQDHPMPFAFQSQSQTGAQALNSTSSLEGGGGFSGSNVSLSSRIAPANQFSNFQQPLGGNPTKAGRSSAFTFLPPNTPTSMQQEPSSSKYPNPHGPVPRPPLVAAPVHSHPQSVSGERRIGGEQPTLGYSNPDTQHANLNTTRSFLPDPAGSSVNQGDSNTLSITQEQFRAARSKYKELRKEHEEAVIARSKAILELESEKERSKELIRRLEDAEKVIEQMKREQETSSNQQLVELDRAQNASTETMKTIIEAINEEWSLKLRRNEERLLREVEQAKRQANEQRESSSTREEERRSNLLVLDVHSDWQSKFEAAEEDRLKLQQELVDLNQAFLRADSDAQVERSAQQELGRQLDDSWARERAHPEFVKAFILLEGMTRRTEGPRDVRVAGSSGRDATRSPVKTEDSTQGPIGVVAKRRRLQ